MCTHHHRFVHEYGYEIRQTGSGEIEFVDDRGRPVPSAPELAKPDRRGFVTIREQNRDLHITNETPALGWDGTPVDYGLAIDGLVCAEERARRAP